MRNATTFIKLDRNILDWGWYQDANTFRVFVHLLLTANIKDNYFMGAKIKRGEVATSYGSIAKKLSLTYDQSRTAVQHLQITNEITIKRHPKFLVISIVNYDRYQDKSQSRTQSNPNQIPNTNPNESQQSKNIKNKENGRFPNGETAEERKKRLEELRNQ
jgi:hypothetical protein